MTNTIANLLGIDPDTFIHTLTSTLISARGEVIEKGNTPEEAKSALNALARGIYTRLFDYIVQAINKLLSYSAKVIKIRSLSSNFIISYQEIK